MYAEGKYGGPSGWMGWPLRLDRWDGPLGRVPPQAGWDGPLRPAADCKLSIPSLTTIFHPMRMSHRSGPYPY